MSPSRLIAWGLDTFYLLADEILFASLLFVGCANAVSADRKESKCYFEILLDIANNYIQAAQNLSSTRVISPVL